MQDTEGVGLVGYTVAGTTGTTWMMGWDEAFFGWLVIFLFEFIESTRINFERVSILASRRKEMRNVYIYIMPFNMRVHTDC